MREGLPRTPASEIPLPDWRQEPDAFWQRAAAATKMWLLLNQLDEAVLNNDELAQEWLKEQGLDQFYNPRTLRDHHWFKTFDPLSSAISCGDLSYQSTNPRFPDEVRRWQEEDQ